MKTRRNNQHNAADIWYNLTCFYCDHITKRNHVLCCARRRRRWNSKKNMQISSREWNWLSNPSSTNRHQVFVSLCVFCLLLLPVTDSMCFNCNWHWFIHLISGSFQMSMPAAWLNRNKSLTLCHVSFGGAKKQNANHPHTHCRLRKQSIDSHLAKLVNHNRSIRSTFSVMCLRLRVCVCVCMRSQRQKLCI